ncbi:SLAM family member 5 [Xenopus laevis]|nr:SLAM family member 5 [Xenopus laevis]
MLLHSCCLLLLFLLPKCVLCDLSCKATESVAAAEGEETILQVNRTGITEISWILKGQHIATSKPNEPVQWKNRQFKTRLGSKPDASLIINKITREDQGTYVTDMRGLEEKDDFIQCYNVTMYRRLKEEDLTIHHHTVTYKSCDMNVSCSINGDLEIGWRDPNNNTIKAATILLYNISTSLYYTCFAENPVSQVHRVVHPWSLCMEDYKLQNIIRLVLSVCIVATGFCFLFCHVKTTSRSHSNIQL